MKQTFMITINAAEKIGIGLIGSRIMDALKLDVIQIEKVYKCPYCQEITWEPHNHGDGGEGSEEKK